MPIRPFEPESWCEPLARSREGTVRYYFVRCGVVRCSARLLNLGYNQSVLIYNGIIAI